MEKKYLDSVLKYKRLNLLYHSPIIWQKGFLISQNNSVNNYVL